MTNAPDFAGPRADLVIDDDEAIELYLEHALQDPNKPDSSTSLGALAEVPWQTVVDRFIVKVIYIEIRSCIEDDDFLTSVLLRAGTFDDAITRLATIASTLVVKDVTKGIGHMENVPRSFIVGIQNLAEETARAAVEEYRKLHLQPRQSVNILLSGARKTEEVA
jgi:hypothetical protein